jgi:hypothetical protein
MKLINFSDFSIEPECVRIYLADLSNREAIGIIESFHIKDTCILWAHSDSTLFTVYKMHDGIEVFESLGPKVVRMWRLDHDSEMTQMIQDLIENFSGSINGLSSMKYFYTEHSCFVWRPQSHSYLPQIKRRLFGLSDLTVIVVHCRQSDIPEGELLEYELESPISCWRWAYALKVAGEVEEMESFHLINSISF